MNKLRLAYVRFTSCCGCQLTLLNCEEQLAAIGEAAEVVAFDMASSRPDDGGPLDVVLVEGSISRPEELVELLRLRRRAEVLVAVGACALTGGVNVLNLVEGEEAIVESPTAAFPPLVVHYAETFIIPAAAGDYTIAPHGPGVG